MQRPSTTFLHQSNGTGSATGGIQSTLYRSTYNHYTTTLIRKSYYLFLFFFEQAKSYYLFLQHAETMGNDLYANGKK